MKYRGRVLRIFALVCVIFNVQAAQATSKFETETKVVSCSKNEQSQGIAHISKQLNAFNTRNFAKAYSFASKEFRSSKTSKQFEEIITTKYSMLLNFKNFKVTSCDKGGQFFMFTLELLDKKGSAWEVRYLLSNTSGVWGVEAAAVSPIDSPKLKA